MNPTELKQKWDQLKAQQPHVRIRNAAEALNVSEAELLATQVGENVIRLRPDFKDILLDIESLGKVMALTRNEECVHERKGIYLNPDFSSPHASLFVGADIDLRIFFSAWAKAFAVTDETARGISRSIQFFDKSGQAIHKIYLTPTSNVQAYETLIEKFKAKEQSKEETIEPAKEPKPELADSEIDVESFQKAWVELKDTHDFFMLMHQHKLTRTQALRLAPEAYYASKIDNNAIVTMLENAAKTNLPIMVFTGNPSMIQIHTGEIKNTLWHQGWFNVMDPDFNLHLDMSKVSQTWVVRKPSEDGIVTSIEVFNEKGDLIVQFFGKRKPGIPELEPWRTLIEDLQKN